MSLSFAEVFHGDFDEMSLSFAEVFHGDFDEMSLSFAEVFHGDFDEMSLSFAEVFHGDFDEMSLSFAEVFHGNFVLFIIRSGTVPCNIVFHVGNALALCGVADDYRGLVCAFSCCLVCRLD